MAALLLALLLMLPPHLVARLTGRSPWPHRFLALAGRIAGLRVRIAGTPLRRDVFYIANHVSWTDILALGGATGCAFVSKDDVGRWPLIGWLAAQNNTILVARDRRAAIGDQIAAMRRAIADHQPVTLFPEGTTGDGRTLLPFKPTLLATLLPPPRDIRVQPVLIDYGDATGIVAWHGDESAGAIAARITGHHAPIPVTLHFLDPIDPAAFADRKALAAACRAPIAAALASSAPARATI